MIPDSHAKSFLSKSYVNAVATQAGYSCQFIDPDYGEDARISEVQRTRDGKYLSSGYQFFVQIKASCDYTKSDNAISYAIEADAYNKLVRYEGGLIVLVLFCVAANPPDRLVLTEDYLQLRHCCYWYKAGAEPTDNTKSKTIHIDRAQVFDPQACQTLMNIVKDRSWA